MHLLAVLRSMWQRVGTQVRLPTPGQNRRRSIFGGLNVRNGQWQYHLVDHKRTGDFIAFLIAVTRVYPLGPIYVIVDNASIHARRTCSWCICPRAAQAALAPATEPVILFGD